MEELKPCPFCGEEARVERDSFSGVFYVGMPKRRMTGIRWSWMDI